MILYADTSALAKRYIREAGSEQMEDLLAQSDAVGTSSLAYVEMASALSKASRIGLAAPKKTKEAWRDFLSHWPDYIRIPVNESLLGRAADIAMEKGLRAYDAIHLSCALQMQEAAGEKTTFACFDEKLSKAAADMGLKAWPENKKK